MINSKNKHRSVPNLVQWFLLFIAAIIFTACGGETAVTVQNTPAPAATPEATETLAPTETPAPTATPSPAQPGELTVDVAITNGNINPLVYGANYGPWSSVPASALEDLKASGITFLRFPGGNWGDDDFVRSNHVDMLKLFLDMIDGKVVATVNLREGTPEQAVEMMQLLEEKEINVSYWSIGNEPNLFADKGVNYEQWDTEFYNQKWREFAEAMLAHDPDILLVGPDLSQYTASESQNPKDEQGRDWMREFLRANGDLVDNISFHRYPFGGSPTVAEVRATSPEWDATIPYLRELILEETGRDIPVSIMEVNSNWSHAQGSDGTPDSFYNAIWWADSLGRIINQGVDMVAYFTLAHNDGTTLLDRSGPRPTYYVYQLYQQFGTEKLYSDSGLDEVSIFAAQREDGTVTLMVVNRGDADVTMPLHVANSAGGETAVSASSRQAILHRFDAAHNAENLGEVSIDELELPGQSISLYVLPGASE
ncbi:MAG: hypothetical protein IAF02_06960 [Anaerolineae bacterium]|nr:hypothetical protein [Anaerolineae bacterium]